MVIQIQTLIDITRTGITRPQQGSQLQIDQNRNFTTLRQCLELRSVITFDSNPSVSTIDIKGLGFGSNFKGKNLVWTFNFTPDRKGVYEDTAGNSLAVS